MRISQTKGGDHIPCPHYDLDIVGRSKDHRSAVASAAYQSGEKLYDEYEQKRKSYPQRAERIVLTEILLPANAPPKYADRNTLWNAVQNAEKRKDAQYARRFVMALPRELSDADNIELLRRYCQEQFVSQGMIADVAYHHDGDGNPHAHVLTTMRPMDEHGNWAPKSRLVYDLDEHGQRIRLKSGRWKNHKETTCDWDDHGNLEKWRHAWEVIQNEYLAKANRPERVDLRSFERQNNELLPTIHLGPEASAMERQGVKTFLGDINRDINDTNALIRSIKRIISSLKEWTEERRETHEEIRAAKATPTLREVLVDYAYLRMNSYSGKNQKYKMKCFNSTFIKMQQLCKELESKGFNRVYDITQALPELSAKVDKAKATIKANAYRRKDIQKLKDAAAIYAATKPIFDTAKRKFPPLPGGRARYEAEHAAELEKHKRAYGRLMKYHGGKLEIKPDEFDAELKQMAEADATANAELLALDDEVKLLKKVCWYIKQVDPELVGEKRSFDEQMAEARR